jgi:hypothetical protein
MQRLPRNAVESAYRYVAISEPIMGNPEVTEHCRRKAIHLPAYLPYSTRDIRRSFCFARQCRRTKMQRGCMKRNSRKRIPDIWQFRWSEISPDGKRLHRKRIVGTVEQCPPENAARRVVDGLGSEINTGARPMNSGAMTVAQLGDQFAQRELANAAQSRVVFRREACGGVRVHQRIRIVLISRQQIK